MGETISDNKKARWNYEILETFEAGIVLEGSEVKSLRQKHLSLAESFIIIRGDELLLKNAYIKPYENSGLFTPDARRTRKLLMKKQEILKLKHKIEAGGLALVPLKAYFTRNLVKISVGLARGKKLYDKRETLKKRAIEMNIRRSMND